MDALYSKGLYPLITKPSRVTTTSATLIDNIFTNVLGERINCGLVLNDLSDHLPVFATFNYQIQRRKTENQDTNIRIRNDEAVTAFRNDLLKQDWKEVSVDEVTAYDSFLNCCLSLYDKHCPTVLHRHTCSYDKTPWITKGLQNACKKKNKLYRDFIISRTEAAEKRYKLYKNKLTKILRQAKKEYYNSILKINKQY